MNPNSALKKRLTVGHNDKHQRFSSTPQLTPINRKEPLEKNE